MAVMATSFALPINVSKEEFFSESTNLLVYSTLPSGNKSTIAIYSCYNSVFSQVQFFLQTLKQSSVLFPKFGKSSRKVFCTFSSRICFLLCWAFCTFLCFVV